MNRKTQRAVLNLAIFGSILSLILYLNLPSAKDKTFAWNRVRYKTTSHQLPEARGLCPGLADSSKPALVVARIEADGDTTWLQPLTQRYHLCIYTADAPPNTTSTSLQVPANRGHEAMAYLTFLIDNYASIPSAGATFVHGARFAWHNDFPTYDNAALLATLNVSSALARYGYHNLRCDWSASTCLPSHPPQRSLRTALQAATEPWNARAVSDSVLPRALESLFGSERDNDSNEKARTALLGRNDAVRAQCCAQFAVARENVWRHERDEYVALRQWLLDGGDAAAPADDRVAGRILSYVWHILFLPTFREGEEGDPASASAADESSVHHLERLNAMACPRAYECYCRLYGRCGLEGCFEPGRCHGQYVVPPGYSLSHDWAATHASLST